MSDICICRETVPEDSFLRASVVVQMGGEDPKRTKHGRTSLVHCPPGMGGVYRLPDAVVCYAMTSPSDLASQLVLSYSGYLNVIVVASKWGQDLEEAIDLITKRGSQVVKIGFTRKEGWHSLTNRMARRIDVDGPKVSVFEVKRDKV